MITQALLIVEILGDMTTWAPSSVEKLGGLVEMTT